MTRLVLLFFLTLPALLRAVTLAPVFGDNLVLQRNQPVPVWGTAAPRERVVVSFGRQRVTATAGADGRWTVRLTPLRVSVKPADLTVSGATEHVTAHDVLVGDVWLCAGQSNMQKPMGPNPPQPPVQNWEAERDAANYPTIRLFNVAMAGALAPQATCRGQWQVCSPQTVTSFSAAAYFFARKLVQDRPSVPIGLIVASVGGTMAQQWTSIPTLKTVPTYRGIAERGAELAAFAKIDTIVDWRKLGELAQQYKTQWWAAHDPGLAWTKDETDATLWKPATVPANYWNYNILPGFEGAVWYRKGFDIPATWAGKGLVVSCPGIYPEGSVFVDGIDITASATRQAPGLFRVPAERAQPGHHVLAIRVIGVNGAGGLVGDAKGYYLAPDDPAVDARINLAGAWTYRIGIDQRKVGSFPLTYGLPAIHYHAMIAPLVPTALTGVLWYQGESDMTGGTHQYYRDVLGALVADWRGKWGRPDLPFLIVQLPNVGGFTPFPTGYAGYARVREAQLATVLHTPGTGLVVTNDIGEPDIHPTNKQDVGLRLALLAEDMVYGLRRDGWSPLFAGMTVEGNRARLRFVHTGGALHTPNGEPLVGFAVAGADGKFVLADAVIDGETVVVSSPQVKAPAVVHYAMTDNTPCNLYNAAGLLASPFRSDCAETVAPWPAKGKSGGMQNGK
jgi:sialate O-acetylesterase